MPAIVEVLLATVFGVAVLVMVCYFLVYLIGE